MTRAVLDLILSVVAGGMFGAAAFVWRWDQEQAGRTRQSRDKVSQ